MPRSRAAILSEVRRDWGFIVARARAKGFIHESPPPGPSARVLGQSTKTRKLVPGREVSILVSYGLPHRASGINACEGATLCQSVCLARFSGHLANEGGAARRAQVWRSALYWGDYPLYMELLESESRSAIRAGMRRGALVAIRPDGGTDLGCGPVLAAALAQQLPDTRPGVDWIVFDYTKRLDRARRLARAPVPGYHLTFSADGLANAANVREAAALGFGVACVTDDADRARAKLGLPESMPLVNGDAHDARFLDLPGAFVALSAKGLTKRTRERARRIGFSI